MKKSFSETEKESPDEIEGIPDPKDGLIANAALKLITLLLGILVAVVLGVLLRSLSRVFLPFGFAFFFSYLLYPIQQRLIAFRIPKAISIALVLLLVFGVLNAAGQIIYASIAAFTREIPRYEQRLEEIGMETLEKMEIPLEDVKRQIQEFDWTALFGGRSMTQTITRTISSSMGTFFGFLGQSILVLVLTIFILGGREQTSLKISKALPPQSAKRVNSILESIQREVQTYLITKTLMSLATGISVTLLLWIMKVDFPLIWGLLSFVLNFIPSIGSILASLFPITVCLIQYGPSPRLAFLIVILVLLHGFIGYILEPKLLGRSMRLSPLLVLLSLIFWAYVWGIPGMILAVPFTSAIKIAFENVDGLKPIAIMMG